MQRKRNKYLILFFNGGDKKLQIEFHGITFEPTAIVVLRWCPKLKSYVHYESCKYCPHAEITCSFEKSEKEVFE